MTTKEATAVALEEEAARLKDELKIVEESKSTSEACEALAAFAQQKDEPFSTSHPEPNEWHKNSGGGGGCNIL